VVFGSDDGRVHAVDAGSGEPRWSVQTGAPVFASPAIDRDLVYVGSRDGSFLAMDLLTGEVAWATDLVEVLSSAAVTPQRVYVGSSDGNLYVLNRADGSVVTQLPVGASVWTSPAVVEGWLYFGAHDSNIHAYRLG